MEPQVPKPFGVPDDANFEQLLRDVVKDETHAAIQPCFERFLEQSRLQLREEISKHYSGPRLPSRDMPKANGGASVLWQIAGAHRKHGKLLSNIEVSEAKKHIDFLERTNNLTGPVDEESTQKRMVGSLSKSGHALNRAVSRKSSMLADDTSDKVSSCPSGVGIESLEKNDALRDVAKIQLNKECGSGNLSLERGSAWGRESTKSGLVPHMVIEKKSHSIESVPNERHQFSDSSAEQSDNHRSEGSRLDDSHMYELDPIKHAVNEIQPSAKKATKAIGYRSPDRQNQRQWNSSTQQKIEQFVRSGNFDFISLLVIVTNAVVVGLQVDHMARHVKAEVPFVYRVLDLTMLAFFTVDVCLRLFVDGRGFFSLSAPGWVWNFMDFVLVLLHIIEEVLIQIDRFQGNESTPNAHVSSSLFRIVRVLRALRVVRVLRVTSFMEDLQLLISCILHSVKSFIWSLTLMILMVYVMGICMAGICVDTRLAYVDEPLSDEWLELTKWFGSVPISMLSLFQAVTGGIDWDAITSPLLNYVSWFAALATVFYISFTVLVVLNVVTGTFVSSALERANDVDAMRKLIQARNVFKCIDIDGSGCITINELEENLEDPKVQAYFRTINVDSSEARGLFKMLDVDDSGQIELDEFLGMCLRLQGTAKAIDLMTLTRETISCINRNAEFINRMGLQIEAIDTQLQKQAQGQGEREAIDKQPQ